MKNLLFFVLISILLISCKKQNSAEIEENISTIKLNKQNQSSDYSQQCGTCGFWAVIGRWIQTGPDASSLGCSPSISGLCAFGQGNYRSTTFLAKNEVLCTFQNVNGSLQITFDKQTLLNDSRLKYFSNNQFTFDYSQYMNEDILKNLRLPIPYLIKKGTYRIISEDDISFKIIL